MFIFPPLKKIDSNVNIKPNQPFSREMNTSNKPNNAVWDALSLAWELGYTIAIPIVVLALLGRLIDKTFNTNPIFLLICIFLSIGISSYSIYIKTMKIYQELEYSSQPNHPKKQIN